MQKYSSKHILQEDPHNAIIGGNYYNEHQADIIIVMDRELSAIGIRKQNLIYLNNERGEIEPHEQFKFVTHSDLLIKCREVFGQYPYLRSEEDGLVGRGWIVDDVVYVAWWGTSHDVKGMWYMVERFLFNKFDQEIYFSYAGDDESVEDEWIRVK